jgi:serine phosphatase RsbU (regulator of sigma subunit)/anti-sigma regulatory factor (Ser/Thr protein kinase)
VLGAAIERKRAEEAVKAERQRFSDVLDALPVYLVLLSPDYHVAFANRFFRERFGESRGRRCFEYLFGRTEPCEVCHTFEVLETRKPLEWEWTGPDGHNYYIHDFPFTDTDGSTLIMETGIDITERKRAEAQILRINRTNRALSRCNEVLIRATDEATLLQQICQIVVEEAGYRLCWVGSAENDEAKSVRLVSQAGFDEGYLHTLHITWADTERGQGPTGTCIRTRQPVLVKNIATDPTMVPWRAEALKRGYASCLAIPLLTDPTAFGALTIYAAEPEAFGAEEVTLLTELASDMAFGITTLRTRLERARVEVALRETEKREEAQKREIDIGFKIQKMLLLDEPPQDIPGLRVAALTIPSQQIDGDFYDFFTHENQCLDVIVADVMGKGIPAALLGAATKSHFIEALSHLMALSKHSKLPEPKEIVTLAHAEMVQQLITLENFVTLCYARVDLNTRTLDFVDCGHTGIIHVHGTTGQCELVRGDNLPLGIREGEIYDQIAVPVAPADVLLFYSDGITEARNSTRELFGVERLAECVRLNRALEPDALVEVIRNAVFTFAASERLADDLTCVAIKVGERQLPLARAEIEMRSALTELSRARAFVRTFCHHLPGAPLDEERVAELELAVNEAASNIMKHAYHDRADQWIHLVAEAFPGQVVIRLHHIGDPLDPAAVPPPVFDGSRESGFGLYLITKSVDEVRYYRDERGRNCIALMKVRTP